MEKQNFGEFNTVDIFDLNGNYLRSIPGVIPEKERESSSINEFKPTSRPRYNWTLYLPRIKELLDSNYSTLEIANNLGLEEHTIITKLRSIGYSIGMINRKAKERIFINALQGKDKG